MAAQHLPSPEDSMCDNINISLQSFQEDYTTELAHLMSVFYTAPTLVKEQILSLFLDCCGPKELRFLHAQLMHRGSHGIDMLRLLPIEIGQRILIFSDLATLGKVQQTCRFWNSVANTNVIWQSALHILQGAAYSPTTKMTVPELKRICKMMRQRDLSWQRCRPVRWDIFPHSDKVTALRIHHDILVSGSYDRLCTVWNLQTRKQISSFEISAVCCVDFLYKQGIIATGSFNREVAIWNMTTGERIQMSTHHTNSVLSICLDNDCVYTGGADSGLYCWDWKQGHLTGVIAGHHGKISSIAIGQTSCLKDFLFSCSYDGTLTVWNKKTFQSLATLNFGQPLKCLDLFLNVMAIATDQTITLVDVEIDLTHKPHIGVVFNNRRELQLEMTAGITAAHYGCIAMNRGYLVSYAHDLTLWRVSPPAMLQNLLEGCGPYSGTLAIDDGRVVVGRSDGQIQVFDFSSCN
ncbi:hypothetical protein BATDEDRAFT_22838 [Batrachochytrium dendrobatidis JAM81]|uniref:F-box domain-containing protein n=1 Tax=Batrachochytrium dendrobatidis (strain JAM81 / FGSC 10211) TaxID=684364 RepID=F4NVX8_BATDJ|nr:uncharacterized protein BATDEDRAFT_22838 [Batrachochytrium dendrobatidis JAM81]EGF82381.1 hypothetical protein BATDEDRAFT_22838 [Batrachochytrium dendrobatidis JAM81]KAJ8328265.1 hypothetical protein O5D80_003628 [Batrachochytrium dendrobatidis]KAK5673329.1 hypothetical protein QVD99_000779 [Batrachochytrium dendrobatidis]|eukprot:XP_006676645.1 hypothetical protein BATDEDRAFT_22838 [Batrachochytrium dendrobatidis JAM81]